MFLNHSTYPLELSRREPIKGIVRRPIVHDLFECNTNEARTAKKFKFQFLSFLEIRRKIDPTNYAEGKNIEDLTLGEFVQLLIESKESIDDEPSHQKSGFFNGTCIFYGGI